MKLFEQTFMKKGEDLIEIMQLFTKVDEKIMEKHENALDRFNKFRTDTQEIIDELVNESVNQKLKGYDKVYKMFGEYMSLGDFNMKINSKATLDHI